MKSTAKTVGEFNEQARKYYAKAKEGGVSNTAMMNTISFMYKMFEREQDNWELSDDGSYLINGSTGDTKPIEIPSADNVLEDIINSGSSGGLGDGVSDTQGLGLTPGGDIMSAVDKVKTVDEQLGEIDSPSSSRYDPVNKTNIQDVPASMIELGDTVQEKKNPNELNYYINQQKLKDIF